MADERDDALMDDVLAKEREESLRGDVRAFRRRTREDEGFDEDAELEEARVPRRRGRGDDALGRQGLGRGHAVTRDR